jgi:hypothetical protein
LRGTVIALALGVILFLFSTIVLSSLG